MPSLTLNTKKSGRVTVFTFKQGRKYISVCLELDIVKEGTDPVALNRDMMEAVTGHVEAVRHGKLSDDLLNRPAPAAYWKIYWSFLDGLKKGAKKKQGMGTINILPIAELSAA